MIELRAVAYNVESLFYVLKFVLVHDYVFGCLENGVGSSGLLFRCVDSICRVCLQLSFASSSSSSSMPSLAPLAMICTLCDVLPNAGCGSIRNTLASFGAYCSSEAAG